MPVNQSFYQSLTGRLKSRSITLVAVSKTKPVEDILALYNLGQRDFGENYVQELIGKASALPADIRWHFIGHLQTNKVKLIVPLVQLIHGVDSLKLLEEINKQSGKINKVTGCLLQVHIAREETKFGLDEKELEEIIKHLDSFEHVDIRGMMGMASFTKDLEMVRTEFRALKTLFDKYKGLQRKNFRLTTLSMGMSGDYELAIEEGSTMVRIGSLIFGERI